MSKAHQVPDEVHLELMEVTHSAVAEVPEVVRRLQRAADAVKREGRLIRMESARARRISNPSGHIEAAELKKPDTKR